MCVFVYVFDVSIATRTTSFQLFYDRVIADDATALYHEAVINGYRKTLCYKSFIITLS